MSRFFKSMSHFERMNGANHFCPSVKVYTFKKYVHNVHPV